MHGGRQLSKNHVARSCKDMKYLLMWGSHPIPSRHKCRVRCPSVTALCRKGMMTPQHHADGELTSSSHWEDTEARGSCKLWGQGRGGERRGWGRGERRAGKRKRWEGRERREGELLGPDVLGAPSPTHFLMQHPPQQRPALRLRCGCTPGLCSCPGVLLGQMTGIPPSPSDPL